MPAYLRSLGVTSAEFLPIHAFVDDSYLVEKGLRNYWGYNSIGFFAPEPRYLHTPFANEFKAAVNQFHAYGIEVILDVGYNHTAEGNELGPTLSFKGIDTQAIIGCCRTRNANTSTIPAPETQSTCHISGFFRWSQTRYAIGSPTCASMVFVLTLRRYPEAKLSTYPFGHQYRVAGRSMLALGLATEEALTRRLRQGLGAIMDVSEFPLTELA